VAWLFLCAALLGACDHPQKNAEQSALNELRGLEKLTAVFPSVVYFEGRIEEAEEQCGLLLKGSNHLTRQEFERSLAWYRLGAKIVRYGRPLDNRTPESCWKEAKLQNNWLEVYLASGKSRRQVMLQRKESDRALLSAEEYAELERIRKAPHSPLNTNEAPEEFFLRQKKPKSTPAQAAAPAVPQAPVAPKPPLQQPRAIVLINPVDARLPFGKVTLAAGTRLEVIAANGPSLQVKYAGQTVTVPAEKTRPAP
jgi:hypothetical protein